MNNHNNTFEKIFNQKAVLSKEAHARVNLIGENTDYTGGYVLPCLLPYKTTVPLPNIKHLKNLMHIRNFLMKKFVLVILLSRRKINGLIT